MKRGKQSNKDGKNKYKKNNKKGNALANATHSTGKQIICYNCECPNCPHPKTSQRTQRPTAKGRAATTTAITSNDESDALVCSAKIVNYAHHPEEIHVEYNDSVRPMEFPNIYYENNVELTGFLNCSVYATIWFETLEHFSSGDHIEAPNAEAFLHDRPMEEYLLDFATIFKLIIWIPSINLVIR